LESVAIGIEGLRLNPLRTLLSTLGVVIGVASLVAILAVGDGAEQWTRDQIAETTTLQGIAAVPITMETVDGVRISRERVDTLTEADATVLAELFAGQAHVWITTASSVRVGTESASPSQVAVLTGVAGKPPSDQWTMTSGRYMTPAELEGGAMVAAISPSLADAMQEAGVGDVLGQDLRINGEAVRVVGVLGSGVGTSPALHVPFSAARRMAPPTVGQPLPGVNVFVGEIEQVDPTVAQLRAWLRTRFSSDDGFNIITNRARVDQAEQAFLVFKLVLGAIAGISILVGGIGIMNVMLASVSERTREIGIRKAIGARKRDILWQFLAESVTVSAVGSALGVVVGLVGAFTITAVIRSISEAPLQAAFTWWTPLVAAVSALLIGVAFGTYPANLAARLSPIDAIRHE
jgi:putative ABC transport system permease protein